jgi:hypothetical protein
MLLDLYDMKKRNLWEREHFLFRGLLRKR